jgi:hypothetical protein
MLNQSPQLDAALLDNLANTNNHHLRNKTRQNRKENKTSSVGSDECTLFFPS